MNPETNIESTLNFAKLLLRYISTDELVRAKKIAYENRDRDPESIALILNELNNRDIPPPEKKKVPLTAEDFPPMFWVRNESFPCWKLVVITSNLGIGPFGCSEISFTRLMEEDWEYSTDRKENKPCYKYE